MVEGLCVLTSGEVGSILSKLERVCDGIIKLSNMKIPTRQLLTDTELSRELKLSKKTLANYRAKGEFGYYAMIEESATSTHIVGLSQPKEKSNGQSNAEYRILPDFAYIPKTTKSRKSVIFRIFLRITSPCCDPGGFEVIRR